MAIPTEEEFREFFMLLNEARGYSFTQSIHEFDDYLKEGFIDNINKPSRFDILLSNFSLNNLELFLDELHDFIEEQDNIRTKHPVQSWLNSNNNFTLATWGVFTGSFEGLNKSEFIRIGKEGTLSILNFDPLTQLLSFDSVEQLEEFYNLVVFGFEYVGHDLLSSLVSYLAIYFYDPSYWRRSRADMPNSDSFPEMKIAIRSSVDLLEYLRSTYLYPEVREKEVLISKLEQLNEDLEVECRRLDISFSPVKAINDKTKDRELIYNLWGLYKKLTGKRGVTNISRLMSLEGIESDYDERAIHKMIKNWEQKQKQYQVQRQTLASDYPRTKFAKNLGEPYW